MLDTQINMYSVDTGHFYSNHEKYLHEMNCKYRRERNYLDNALKKMEEILKENGYTDDDIKELKKIKQEEYNNIQNENEKLYVKNYFLICHKRKKAKESKEKLLKV